MMLTDHIENAYRSLRRNRGRSILTTLGIAIGVASVVTILALGGGASRVIDRQVEALGGNLTLIRPGAPTLRDINSYANPVAQTAFGTSTLTEEDVATLSQLPHAAAVVPLMTIEGTLTAGKTSVSNTVVVATTTNFTTVSKLSVREGQFIDSDTAIPTAVLGHQLAIDLFGTERPIGQTFTLRGQRFMVSGVLNTIPNPINYNNVDFNHAALISLTSGKQFHQGRPQIQQINVQADSPQNLSSLTSAISESLRRNHQGEEDFTIVTGKDIGTPTSQLFRALIQVMTAIAAISLLVGGIGIMNIMLVGVAERTREIGIRKAVGASNHTIITQFLIESLMISLLGGFFGYLLGYVAAFIICNFLFFAPAITWSTALAAFAMSTGVGIVFGLYPALRAARKDTIESLRQYH